MEATHGNVLPLNAVSDIIAKNLQNGLYSIMKASSILFVSIFIGSSAPGDFFSFSSLNPFSYDYSTMKDFVLSVPYDLERLKVDLDTKVFGQPLIGELYHILKGHKRSIEIDHPGRKALTISLHGWTGTGKTYVSKLIAGAIYHGGMDSICVKMFIGRHDFPDARKVAEYQEFLKRQLQMRISVCKKALIIFDEVDDIPAEVLDILRPMTDHHPIVDGYDYRSVIFIFLSNMNGQDIYKHLKYLNKPRNKVTLNDFEAVLQKGAYKNTGSGLFRSKLIKSHNVDHFIPFLPLEEEHVELCIKADFRAQGIYNVPNNVMEHVKNIVVYGPDELPIYSNSGCKRLHKHVAFAIQKFRLHKNEL